MIAYLKGKIIDTSETQLVLSNNGIGWLVNVGSHAFIDGIEQEFYIHTQVKEDDISLWGFTDRNSLKLFKLLISISGVGGKTAQTLITEKGFEGVINAISMGSADSLKVSGIGKKTAEKIIVEISDKIAKLFDNVAFDTDQSSVEYSSAISEAVEALNNLGYKISDVNEIINLIKKDGVELKDTQSIIKEVLKRI